MGFFGCVICWSLILVVNIWRAFSCLLRSSELEAGSIANCTGNEIQSSCLKYKQLLCPVLPYFLHSYTPALVLSFLFFNNCLFVWSRFTTTSVCPLLLKYEIVNFTLTFPFSLLHCLLLPFCVVFTDFLLCTTSDKHVLQKVSSPLCPFRKPRKISSTERYFRQSERTGQTDRGTGESKGGLKKMRDHEVQQKRSDMVNTETVWVCLREKAGKRKKGAVRKR